MSQDESTQNTTSSTSEVQKATPSEIELLTQIVKDQKDTIANVVKSNKEQFETLTKTLEELKKQQDANPVDHGSSKEEKPKVSDNDDAGGKVKDEPSYAPDGDAQASIRAPADEASKTDSVKVSKSDESEKKESDSEKKAEEKKEDKSEEKVEKATAIRKSVAPDGFEYEFVKAESFRPKVEILPRTPQNAPTGYQVMKAMFNGWGGKHTVFEKSFIEGYERLLKGEFGTGDPSWGVA